MFQKESELQFEISSSRTLLPPVEETSIRIFPALNSVAAGSVVKQRHLLVHLCKDSALHNVTSDLQKGYLKRPQLPVTSFH